MFLFNIIVDFLIGLIPIVGDIVEVMYKANSRNALVLEKHLKKKGQIALGLREPPINGEHHDVKSIQDIKSIASNALSENSDEGDSTTYAKSPLKHRVNPKENIELRNQLNVGKDPAATPGSFRERTYSK